MHWKKLGLVYTADRKYDWTQSHAFIPTPILLNDDLIRVYVAFRDKNNVGRIGFVDVQSKNPTTILRVSQKPVFDIGEPGTFDDNGVNPMTILPFNGYYYLYYVGWQLGTKVRYTLLTGIARSSDGNSFVRIKKTPILERSDNELFVRTAAHVKFHEGRYKMWYIAGDSWIEVKGKMVPTYNMRYLESIDGLHWGSEGKVCLDLSSSNEYGFGRPYILVEDNLYKMWYSIRYKDRGYRLGYAESKDGQHWIRKDDEVGIDVSKSGWDSEMICFCSIIDTAGKRYMFYNGNNYGETGFGVAVLEE